MPEITVIIDPIVRERLLALGCTIEQIESMNPEERKATVNGFASFPAQSYLNGAD